MQHRPKKSLGQNFLHDANVAQKIVRSFDPSPADIVVEIGPGKGALTSLLLEILPHITVVEIDNQLVPELQERFGEKITIVHDDILNVDLNSLLPSAETKLRILGNIPYYITSPILFHIVDHRAIVKDFIVMMQTEVAQRLVAKPRTKDYGILSVFLQYYCTPKMLFSVSKNSFYPVPQVSSAIVHLDFEVPFSQQATNEAVFRKIVRGTFGKRRKTLRNGLRSLNIPPDELEKLSVDLELRPEELHVGDFVTLANELTHLSSILVSAPAEESNE
jgi:16S rRNA (adenine1518-N6/adenine1519-N6)-dimethyltransferase